MRKLTLFLLLSFFSFKSLAQLYGSNTTSNFTNEAIDIEIDASGNKYVAGYICGETSFNATVVQPSAIGNGDIYVAKYNPQGNLIWIKQFGGNFSDRPTDLCLGTGNSIFITGQYFGQLTFGTYTLNSIANSKDIFVLKLDDSGNVVWAFSEGGTGSENAYGLATDSQNNLILTGQFEGNSTLIGQSFASTTDPNTLLPSYDLFISKYDQAGSALWIKTGVAEYEDRGLAVDCDDQNNIFLIGQFSDTLAFGGSTINNMGFNVGFLAKFSPNGTMQWFNQLRAGMVMPYDLEVNNLNEVVIAGDYIGNFQYYTASGTSTIVNTYPRKLFALKTNNNGNFLWGTALGSNNELSARSISIDDAKNSYITGYFRCDLSQIHDTNTALFNSVGFKDPYLLKITNSGSIEYIKQFGGKGNDEGTGVAISPSNSPEICGSYTHNLNIKINSTIGYSISTNNFHFKNNLFPYSFVYLHGDSTRNSFLTNGINQNTPAYNYFISQPTDSLYGMINNGQDTLHFCDTKDLFYNAQTLWNFGPSYSYLWNTGETNDTINITTTGQYFVFVERSDECSMGADTIFAIHHDDPLLPLMTDNLGLAVNQTGVDYYNYNFCAPDSVQTWFTNICSSCSIDIIKSPNTLLYTDTLPHFYDEEGEYNITISDSFCTNYGYFTIDLDYALPYDSLSLYFSFPSDGDLNDTITICSNSTIPFHIYDYITNPDTTLNLFNLQPIVDAAINISPYTPGVLEYNNKFEGHFAPTTTGWYQLNYSNIIGYDNLCGLDTTAYSIYDSIYVIVNPLPSASTTISADNLLCPNGSAILSLSNVINGFDWSGPGIAWTSANNDSIQVTVATTYHYSGTITDTTTGCFKQLNFPFTLQMKNPPSIIMDPVDGIICPYDSVIFTLPNNYLSYEWIGPDGDTISTTNTAIDDDQGFYYCHVVDAEGCSLTTTPVELIEFTTPSLYVDPSIYICPGGSTTITATYTGNVQLQWSSPFQSNADEITATQIGYYICEIQQCGMTFIDSIEILDGSFTVSIATNDTLLCYQENATVFTTGNYVDYEWSDGSIGVNSVNTTEAGQFSVSVTNQFGCIAQSNTIVIQEEPLSFPPDVQNVSICSGSNAIVANSTSNLLDWYSVDTTFLVSSSSIQLLSVYSDTSLLAAYNVPNCPTEFTSVLINVVDSLPGFSIQGDSLLCPNESTLLTLATTTENVQWYVNGIPSLNASSIQIPGNSYPNNVSTIAAIVSNQCFSDTLNYTITVFIPEPISLSADSLTLCAYATVPITANGNFDTLIWTSISGSTSYGDTNLVSAQYGNGYIYVQGIDFNGCESSIDSIYVTSSQLNFDLYQSFDTNCMFDSLEVGIVTNSDSLIWETPFGIFTDTNSFTIELNDLTVGNYSIDLWDSLGCHYSDSISIDANELPYFSLTNDTILCLSDWLNLENLNDSISYSWEGFGVLDSLPIQNDSWYLLTGTGQNGCAYTDSIYIDAIDCQNALPNVITPNNDGINDFLYIDDATVFLDNELVIVNRWGTIIYKMERYDNTFGGVDLSDGVYFYTFTYDINKPNSKITTGFIHIIHE